MIFLVFLAAAVALGFYEYRRHIKSKAAAIKPVVPAPLYVTSVPAPAPVAPAASGPEAPKAQ